MMWWLLVVPLNILQNNISETDHTENSLGGVSLIEVVMMHRPGSLLFLPCLMLIRKGVCPNIHSVILKKKIFKWLHTTDHLLQWLWKYHNNYTIQINSADTLLCQKEKTPQKIACTISNENAKQEFKLWRGSIKMHWIPHFWTGSKELWETQ